MQGGGGLAAAAGDGCRPPGPACLPEHLGLPLCLLDLPACLPALQGVSVSQLDVRDVIWREDLGGEQLELGE